MNCKFKFHLRAAIHRGAAGPVGSAEVGGPTGVPGGAPPADGIRFTVLRIPRVRTRKPSSLALRAGVREPGQRPGRLFRNFRHGVRAWKPISKALPAPGREPGGSAGRVQEGTDPKDHAQKPISLALPTPEREPGGSAGRVQEGTDPKVRAQKPISLALPAPGREP